MDILSQEKLRSQDNILEVGLISINRRISKFEQFYSHIVYNINTQGQKELLMRNSEMSSIVPTSFQHVSQRRERDLKYKARQIQEQRYVEMINKKLPSHKRLAFPELHSNALKKSLHDMLIAHQNNELSPITRYKQHEKINRQTNIFQNQAEIYAARMQKNCFKSDKSHETIGNHKKIGKSFSQTKRLGHLQQFSSEALIALRRSDRPVKMATEQSATSTSSKQIYERLTHLKKKDMLVSIQRQEPTPQKDHLKEYKHSSFVLKFKVAQSHHQEKAQLKTLKNSRNDNPTNHLRENIKIKNYTKFFSNETDLQK